ncbi:MAG: DUF2235 domain-containing protein [Zoogloeaceae bacterium]|nr:DUF2235 domain-containing protein [Zoogloeaceae bacterium]
MSRQIVVCMDGTWNDPTERTNVYKLFRTIPGSERPVAEAGALRQHLRRETPEIFALYLEGVGAKGRSEGILGGSLGLGLHDRVIDAFILVSRIYQPGDKFWIFGFSRGAWAARSLAGFIANAGLLENPGAEDAAVRAEKLWLNAKNGKLDDRGTRFWEAAGDARPIRLVGVWDTVGALGIPFFNGLRVVDGVEARLFEFADTDLSSRVEFGRQALAVDETRFDFTPTLWNDRAGISQAWLPGVHGDVGGGYAHTGLSDGALQWMIEEVNALDGGLTLTTAALGAGFTGNPLADRHDEARQHLWKLRPREPRKVAADAPLAAAVHTRLAGRADYRPAALRKVVACGAFFANDVVAPEERLVPLQETGPTLCMACDNQTIDCVVFAQKWWNAAGIEVHAGERYRIEALGTWTDKENEAGATGYESNSTVLNWAEGTRRVEKAPWFALIAAVHADPGLELKNPSAGNMVFGIAESFARGVGKIDDASQLTATGDSCELAVRKDGYLYFFANDSAFAYSNNSGFLDVRVTRIT